MLPQYVNCTPRLLCRTVQLIVICTIVHVKHQSKFRFYSLFANDDVWLKSDPESFSGRKKFQMREFFLCNVLFCLRVCFLFSFSPQNERRVHNTVAPYKIACCYSDRPNNLDPILLIVPLLHDFVFLRVRGGRWLLLVNRDGLRIIFFSFFYHFLESRTKLLSLIMIINLIILTE